MHLTTVNLLYIFLSHLLLLILNEQGPQLRMGDERVHPKVAQIFLQYSLTLLNADGPLTTLLRVGDVGMLGQMYPRQCILQPLCQITDVFVLAHELPTAVPPPHLHHVLRIGLTLRLTHQCLLHTQLRLDHRLTLASRCTRTHIQMIAKYTWYEEFTTMHALHTTCILHPPLILLHLFLFLLQHQYPLLTTIHHLTQITIYLQQLFSLLTLYTQPIPQLLHHFPFLLPLHPHHCNILLQPRNLLPTHHIPPHHLLITPLTPTIMLLQQLQLYYTTLINCSQLYLDTLQ